MQHAKAKFDSLISLQNWGTKTQVQEELIALCAQLKDMKDATLQISDKLNQHSPRRLKQGMALVKAPYGIHHLKSCLKLLLQGTSQPKLKLAFQSISYGIRWQQHQQIRPSAPGKSLLPSNWGWKMKVHISMDPTLHSYPHSHGRGLNQPNITLHLPSLLYIYLATFTYLLFSSISYILTSKLLNKKRPSQLKLLHYLFCQHCNHGHKSSNSRFKQ